MRLIANLTTDIELARNAIATPTTEVEPLDARLQHLTATGNATPPTTRW